MAADAGIRKDYKNQKKWHKQVKFNILKFLNDGPVVEISREVSNYRTKNSYFHIT